MGFDEAYLVTDAALAGSDTAVTTRVLAEAIRKLPDVGMVLTGELSIDGATAQIAPRLAEALGWPVVTSVYEASLENGTLKASRNGEGRREQVEATGSLVLSVSLDSPKPRIPNAMGVMKAAKKPLTTWSLADLGLDAASVGQEGSCTWVTRTFKPEKREKGETLQGDASELAKALLERLTRKNLVQV
ncbi:Electron transfer flavoprotein subunit beta [compost metagenome]